MHYFSKTEGGGKRKKIP